MRIRTDGKYQYREDEIEWASKFWDCNKTEAVLRSIEFTRQINAAFEKAIQHPDMTEELAKLLSTSEIQLIYEINTSIKSNK